MKIYLARPISGCDYDEVVSYYRKTSVILKARGYEVMHPMVAKNLLRGENRIKPSGYTAPLCTDHAILERDRWMVQRSDVVMMNLLGARRVSIGCVAELAFGHVYGKYNVVLMEKENLHRHAFVLDMASIIFETEDEALTYLHALSYGKI